MTCDLTEPTSILPTPAAPTDRPAVIAAARPEAANPAPPSATTFSPLGPAEPRMPIDQSIAERTPGIFSPLDATVVLIAAMIRLLADSATTSRAIVSAVNALLALERQRLAGRIGLAGLLAEEVRLAIVAALTRVLADEAASHRTTIAAANALLGLERNRLRAERHERLHAKRADPANRNGSAERTDPVARRVSDDRAGPANRAGPADRVIWAESKGTAPSTAAADPAGPAEGEDLENGDRPTGLAGVAQARSSVGPALKAVDVEHSVSAAPAPSWTRPWTRHRRRRQGK
jgi:hypothetical protein